MMMVYGTFLHSAFTLSIKTEPFIVQQTFTEDVLALL